MLSVRNIVRVLEIVFYLVTLYFMWHLGVTPTERLPWATAIGYGVAHMLAAVVVPILGALRLFLLNPARKDGWLLFWAGLGFWLIYFIDITFRHYLVLRKLELAIFVAIMLCIKAVVIFSRLKKQAYTGEVTPKEIFRINYKPIMMCLELVAFYLVATLVHRHGFYDSSALTSWHSAALFGCNTLVILGFSFVATFVVFWVSWGRFGMFVAWATFFLLLQHLVSMEYFGQPLLRAWEFWTYVAIIIFFRAVTMVIWYLNDQTGLSHVTVKR